jgi:hypothetical protein
MASYTLPLYFKGGKLVIKSKLTYSASRDSTSIGYNSLYGLYRLIKFL